MSFLNLLYGFCWVYVVFLDKQKYQIFILFLEKKQGYNNFFLP